mgnify:CR=1 FL=1
MYTRRPIHRENGNILFLILLAIILFVALSYAIMGQRDGSKDASSESMKAKAAQMIQAAALMEQTVNRLRLVNGCKDTEISFENTMVSGYVNAATPADGRCKVFDKAGGGLSWPDNPSYSKDFDPDYNWTFGGQYIITNVGTSDYELLMHVHLGGDSNYPSSTAAAKKLCEELDQSLLGQTTQIRDTFPTAQSALFTGVYGSKTIILGDEVYANALPPGLRSACFQRANSAGGYAFYHVLIAR